jgi:cyclase
MIGTRIMPCLLLRGEGLVKTRRFASPTYLGDPRNIVRIFNEKEVDEFVLLDILATKEGRGPNLNLIREIVDEAFAPMAYGGGITALQQAHDVLSMGVEKVVINATALDDPQFVVQASAEFGRQSVVVSLDVRKTLLGSYRVVRDSGLTKTGWDPADYARHVVELGAGEILLQSVDRDGTMQGYDLRLVRTVVDAVPVPVIACGGAGSVEHLQEVVHEGGAAAAAAGSLFVFQGPHHAVLISFPDHETLVTAGLRDPGPTSDAQPPVLHHQPPSV